MDSPGKPTAATKSQLDPPGEVSSDSEGALSFTDSSRAPVNLLLPPSDYVDLPRVKSDRAEWVPGYRGRVTRYSIQVAPWFARKISRISVAEMNVDFIFRHFAKPKLYPFPVLKVSNNPSVAADWAPGLGG